MARTADSCKVFANALDNLLTFDLKLNLLKMTSVPLRWDVRAPGSTMKGLDPVGYRSDPVATLRANLNVLKDAI